MKKIKNNDTITHVWCGQEISAGDYYEIQPLEEKIWANNSTLLTAIANEIAIVNNGSSDISDINTAISYLKDDLPKEVEICSPFNANSGCRMRYKGFSGTAIAGTTTTIDWKITANRKIVGCRSNFRNHVFGDYAHFEVVDVDNILGYGNNVVLDRFIDSWYVSDDSHTQRDIICNYCAHVYAGLYFRCTYVSNGENNVDIKVNFFLHQY